MRKFVCPPGIVRIGMTNMKIITPSNRARSALPKLHWPFPAITSASSLSTPKPINFRNTKSMTAAVRYESNRQGRISLNSAAKMPKKPSTQKIFPDFSPLSPKPIFSLCSGPIRPSPLPTGSLSTTSRLLSP